MLKLFSHDAILAIAGVIVIDCSLVAVIKISAIHELQPQINSAGIVFELPLTNQWSIKIMINSLTRGNISAL